MIDNGDIVVITGIMAAGKSTIAQALAERLPRSVHLRGDAFRHMIVNGQAIVSPENWEAAERQVRMRYRLATQAAVTYAESGFAVVNQDVILGPDFRRLIDWLEPGRRQVYAIVLVPEAAVAAQRDLDRRKTGYGAWSTKQLDASLRGETPRLGLWLDTSAMTVHATVESILAQSGEARVSAR